MPAAVAQASSLQRREFTVISATAGKEANQGGAKVLAKNRKARHLYNIVETFESGIALQGTEVKSVRDARVNLKDSYAKVENGELFIYNMHISPYTHGNRFNHEPLRPRKLLMHRREINRLGGYVQEKGLTLVPLSIYLRRGKVKVELALARGKRDYDKRQDIAERDAKREMERAFKDRQQDR